jgi:uncharacterized protein YukE
MSTPNPLVAERQDSTTAISGIGVVESAVDVHNGISNGSWIEGGLGLVGGGLETLGLVIDPVGTLVSYGVAWLMEHVKPLSDALDWLAGDPDTIASYAQTWRNVSQAVAQARTNLDGSVATDTAAWTGAAADAYRAQAAQQGEQLTAASTAAETVGTVVEVVGVLVGVVREVVRDLVADCVATLIARIPQWLAEIAGTLGAATPHVVASAVALISKWVARISDVIRKLVRSIEKLRPLLRRLDEIWAAVRGGLRGLTPSSPSTPGGTSTSPSSPNPVTDPGSVSTPTVTPGGPATPGTGPGPTPGTAAGTPTVDGATGTPTSTSPTATAPASVADTPTIRSDGPTTAASPTTPTATGPDGVSPVPASPTGTGPVAESGGRQRPRDPYDMDAQGRWAERAYDEFRSTDADVDAIANNLSDAPRLDGSSGFSPEEITSIKRHLMEQEHPLNVYDHNGNVVGTEIRRFDADPDIADAWARMADGRATPQDIKLLEHELAELNYMRDHPGATYAEAHQHANTVSNWADSNPPSTREDLGNLPWKRDGSDGGGSTDTTPQGRGDGPPQTGGRGPGVDPAGTPSPDGSTPSPISEALDAGAPAAPDQPSTVDGPGTPDDAGTDVTDSATTDSGPGPTDGDTSQVNFGDRDPSDPYPSSETGPSFESDLDAVLADYGITREEFHHLASRSADDLTPEQARIVHDVRHAVELTPNTIVAKVLPEEVARNYLNNSTDGGFNPDTVGGFFARQGDVAAFNSPSGLYDGLALGYDNTPFTPAGDRIFSIRFEAGDSGAYSIPFGGNSPDNQTMTGFGGGSSGTNERSVFDPPPFTGTGFTGSGDHIVPEFTRDSGEEIPHGAAIYEVDASGNERVVGVYGGTGVSWIPVNGGIW